MVRRLTIGLLTTILLLSLLLRLVLTTITTRRRVLALRRISARRWIVGLLRPLAIRTWLATWWRLRTVLIAAVGWTVVLMRWLTTRRRRVLTVLGMLLARIVLRRSV